MINKEADISIEYRCIYKYIMHIWMYTSLAILCDLLKWLSDLQLRDEKVTLNHLVYGLYAVLYVLASSVGIQVWSHEEPSSSKEEVREWTSRIRGRLEGSEIRRGSTTHRKDGAKQKPVVLNPGDFNYLSLNWFSRRISEASTASRSLTCWHSSLACWHLRAGTCFNAFLICFL